MENGPKFTFTEPKEGIARVYSNDMQIAQTECDVRLTFGEITEVTDEYVVENRAVVTVSRWELKRMVDLLQRYLANFEAKNGALQPPDLSLEPDNMAEFTFGSAKPN